MPLTPAHAAAVIPLRKCNACFWLSPLVVGSMAPDYFYFVFPRNEVRHFGHSALGLIVFCIPVSLAVLYLFHSFVKRPLVLLMPRPLRARLWPYCGPFPILPLKRLAWIIALIYFGAVTHVLWDGFTHENGFAISGNSQLQGVLFTVQGHDVHAYGLFQYASSLLGLGLVAWWSWRWYLIAPLVELPEDSPRMRYLRPAIASAMLFFGAGVGITRGMRHAMHVDAPFAFREFCSAAFITGVDAFGVALLVFCLLVHFRQWRTVRQA